MSDIDYIPQLEDDGCLVACVAMVTGRPYADIRQLCAPSYNEGIHEIIADDLLGELGYAVMRRYRHVPHLKRERAVWPCPPFAPVHICYVDATRGPHAVVMLRTGDIYDPWKRERLTLAHPDFGVIDHIDGVFKITRPSKDQP